MKSITQFITQKLKLKVNETKSAVARPQERKFLGFSFTDGPEVKRAIAPKALDRFKRRVREITRRAKGVSIETTMEELTPYMRGWRSYFGLLRNTSRPRVSYLLGPRATSRGSLATVENTTSSSGSSLGTGGTSKTSEQHCWQRTRLLVPRSRQGPIRRAFLRLLQLARSSDLGGQALAQPSRTAVYGPVRTVVWQGSAGNRCPYADQVRFWEAATG
jgi:hypothetical protein